MEWLSKIIGKSIENWTVILFSALLFTFAWHFLLSRKKYVSALLFATLGLLSIGTVNGLIDWLSGLGGDSFLELNAFNWREALFWLATFRTLFLQILIQTASEKPTIVVLLDALLLSAALHAWSRRRLRLVKQLALLEMVMVSYLVFLGYSGFAAGRGFIDHLAAEFGQKPQGFSSRDKVDMLVYIGESTSSLNMSLYGYPFPTTPRLDYLASHDAGFLRFDKVRSTHTHTSLSLLRALSITVSDKDLHHLKYGIGAILHQAGLQPRLYSIQPLNGSFASFSHFIYDGMRFDLHPEDRYKGNFSEPRTEGHQLLETALATPGVVFFHSYAGHGPYLNFIDPSLTQPVAMPDIQPDGLFGNSMPRLLRADLRQNVADYNQAITYIDRNVAHAIDNIRQRLQPAVLVYFSDHGDSAYTLRGHDSSRYIDEMSTVPLILYFNQAYQDKYPDRVRQYRQAAAENRVRLLDQITPSILDLLGVSSATPLPIPTLASHLPHPRPYILKRDIQGDEQRINIDYDLRAGLPGNRLRVGTPAPTYIATIHEKLGPDIPICYHRSNSIAKALRGAAITNCLEFDMVVEGDKLTVHHPPLPSTGMLVEDIFKIAEARKTKLWIDSKNLDQPEACLRLLAYLGKNRNRVGQLLVEFPPPAIQRLPELQQCGAGLRALGARTSYYVNGDVSVPCAMDPAKNAGACNKLEDIVEQAVSSGIFTNLSFDFDGYAAIKKIPAARQLKWGTWAIRAEDFHAFPRQDFDFIIMDTSSDPNTY
ncbi:sulfatase-like hydrolase/transferase [Chromobacterium sp. IIBBL 290-4]|uniref:sulfatase-like hydrolase/transferase n=1 Tax=Chromobacterium sp. IIBBL 290-4 TaxID=2953890 RepID=UPI0020B66467|nr:sulfatase-like hydrolase/transferase [Chromobacterium sp. IIBBL 290-4]UTH76222.1 sulfatase-like hydrolase/transferase [Chromobacterium sp. IIBBL 290-4]